MNFLQWIKTLNCCYFSPDGSFLFQGRRMCVKGQRQWTMNTVANKKKCLKSGLVIKLYTFVSCFSWCYFFHSSGGWPPFSYLLWLSLNHKIPEKVQKMLILKNYQKLSTINNMLIEFWGHIVIFLLKKTKINFFFHCCNINNFKHLKKKEFSYINHMHSPAKTKIKKLKMPFYLVNKLQIFKINKILKLTSTR